MKVNNMRQQNNNLYKKFKKFDFILIKYFYNFTKMSKNSTKEILRKLFYTQSSYFYFWLYNLSTCFTLLKMIL